MLSGGGAHWNADWADGADFVAIFNENMGFILKAKALWRSKVVFWMLYLLPTNTAQYHESKR